MHPQRESVNPPITNASVVCFLLTVRLLHWYILFLLRWSKYMSIKRKRNPSKLKAWSQNRALSTQAVNQCIKIKSRMSVIGSCSVWFANYLQQNWFNIRHAINCENPHRLASQYFFVMASVFRSFLSWVANSLDIAICRLSANHQIWIQALSADICFQKETLLSYSTVCCAVLVVEQSLTQSRDWVQTKHVFNGFPNGLGHNPQPLTPCTHLC